MSRRQSKLYLHHKGIAWSSNEYIREVRQLELGSTYEIGKIKTDGMGENTVIAILVNKSTSDGEVVLESQLQLNASATSTNPTVTCLHVANDERQLSSFEVLGMNKYRLDTEAKGSTGFRILKTLI